MVAPGISEPTKFVTFKLDEEVFALEINQVREVLDYTVPTRVPQTPKFMRGVINLRGSVVPVVDLRLKFGMEETPKTVDTRIVIVEVSVDGEAAILGALADSVKEVIELEPDRIGPAPRIGTRLRTEFIRGMGRMNEEFIIILDINQVFSVEELAAVQELEQTGTGQDGGSAKTDGLGRNAPSPAAAAAHDGT
ncbi:MAG: chemotaxis protein CheW [Pseudomonadota bacterium]